MISIVYHIALVVLLTIAFYQDWKFRAISWIVFPALALVTTLLFIEIDLPWEIIRINLLFLSIVIGCLFLYVSLKRKRLTNIFKQDFGLGDVLFLIAITPLFAERNFILFFISGMLISGIIHGMVSLKNENKQIPLAGYLALYLIALKGVEVFSSNDLFYNPVF